MFIALTGWVLELLEKQTYPTGPLHGRVAHEMGRLIVSGAIAEGGFLPRETELSKKFDVSRQAVREGLKVLAAKGLVNSRRRAGTYVLPRRNWNLFDPDVLAWHPPASLAPEFFSDLIELRRTVEPAAAATAALRAKPEDIAQIGESIEVMRSNAVINSDVFLEADAEFHTAILSASGNVFFVRLSTVLGPLLDANFRIQTRLSPSLSSAVKLHEAVFEGIAARDPERAKNAMERVVGVASDQTLRAVDKVRTEFP